MSNNSTNNEVPMEDLFRDISNDYSIPTDEKDLEDFMNQLDETGYFDKPKKRFIYFIFLAIFLLAGSLSIFYLINNKTDDVLKPSVEGNSSKEPEVNANSIAVDTLKVETPYRTKEQSTVSSDKVKGKINKQETVTTNTRLNNTDQKVNNTHKVTLPSKDTVAVTTNHPKETIDTLNNQSSDIAINKKPKVTYRIVEKVDTVSVADTTRISKRKHEKLKNKN